MQTTFIMVTVLFGVICGNRLMDSRLLRSVGISYDGPYKPMNDNNVNSLNGEVTEVLKLKNRGIADRSVRNLPCAWGNIDIEHDLTARNCNENLVNMFKQSTNYVAYDSNDDLIHKVNDFKSYIPLGENDDEDSIDDESADSIINSRNMKLMQSKLNMFPVADYNDFYHDLVVETTKDEMTKRNGNSLASALSSPTPRGCDCKIRVSSFSHPFVFIKNVYVNSYVCLLKFQE